MIASNVPLTPEGDGRDPRGRFAPGNRAGRGNPHAIRVQKLRSAMLKAVSPDDLREVTETVVRLAKGGDLVAAELLYDRLFGKVIARDTELEELLEQARGRLGATR